MSFRDALTKLNPDALFADGFDDAYIGYIGNRWAKDSLPIAVYSQRKCIEILMREMSECEAEEFFDFNVVDAYVGPHTPMFLMDREEEDEDVSGVDEG